jgi:SAM-dependent methyltransferase
VDLVHTNLFYRRPTLYDQVQADPDHSVAKLCEGLMDAHGPREARTLLDFGCGTGRDLERFAERYECVGVDLQPQMVEYARQTRSALDIRAGDMRSFRLGQAVDVITCLGNSLAYLHKNEDVQLAFSTFAAHARTGTLLVLLTPISPIQQAAPKSSVVRTADLDAEVTVSYEWDLRTQINTMHRRWQFADGVEVQDVIRRRVLFPREIELYLASTGFDLLEIFNPGARQAGELTGPSACIAARYVADQGCLASAT